MANYENLDPERRGQAVREMQSFFVGDMGLEILHQNSETAVYYSSNLTVLLLLRDPEVTLTWIDVE